MTMRARRSTGWVVALGVVSMAAAADAGTLRVLLLSGQNNHDWKTTTPALVEMYRQSGRFDVTVTNEPATLTADSFAAYDVVVSNWTPWPNIQKRVWDAATEKAFLGFVRGGKGVVVFHAASTAMQSWPEFQQIACATWAKGQTGHGKRHEFAVKIADPAHPITAGMKAFRIFDELWHRMGARPEAKPLCTAFSAKTNGGSGQDEPVAFWTRFGEGRGYNLVLGHDVRAMRCAGWRTLMLRGTEWAATGKVTLPVQDDSAGEPDVDIPAALKAVYGYKFGDSRKPLMALRKVLLAAAADPARRRQAAGALARSLAAQVTTDYKKFACEQLGLIGTDAEVSALAGLLEDKALSLAARSALQRMAGEASLAAMRAALAKADGERKVGLICSLGERRDAKAAKAIAEALTDKDPVTAGAAVDALGKIGGPVAVEALSAAGAKLPGELAPRLADALLRCAEGLRAAGERAAAAAIYEHLSVPGQPRHVRVAAFPGLVACRREKATELMMSALRGQDAAMQRAAVRAVRAAGDTPALMTSVAGELPKLASGVQAMLIETLADRGVAEALPAVAKAAGDEDGVVRRAALSALGRLGDASTVPLLAARAAGLEGVDRQVARRSLVRLRGTKVDGAMVAALKSAEPPVRRELIAALGERRAVSAVAALLNAARDEDAGVRAEAVKALGLLAPVSVCPDLIVLLMKPASDADRTRVEQALVAVCRRADADAGVAHVLGAMDRKNAELTASLLRVLARLGGAKALKEVRAAVADKDPAVRAAGIRALAEWPTAEPLEDLIAVAEKAADDVSRVLALRGFVRLAGKATDRAPDALAGLYWRALDAARRPEEKKTLLGGMGGVRSVKALSAAEVLMKQPALAKEAAAAVVKIADRLWVSKPAVVKAAMRRVLDAPAAKAVHPDATRILLELSKPPNLARDATATSPDGLEKDGQASGDQAAIDGNAATYWDEANGKKLYRLLVTFPEPRTVAAVRILGYQQHSYAPKDFEVLCDGKVVQTVRNAQYRANRLTVVFPKTQCTTVELKITGYYGLSPAVRELEIFGADPVVGEKVRAVRMSGKPSLAWKQTPESLALQNHGRDVWRFDAAKSGNGKSYFHPLGLLDGTALTGFRPPDHPWHRAAWFCWKHVNGLNYWEEDRKTGVSPGVTEVKSVKIAPARDHSARIDMTLSYHPPKQPELLAEKRTILVTAPDAEGCYRVDWSATFTAGASDVLLKGGTSGGGYAGLSARLAVETRDWKVLNSEGLADGAAHGKKARWVAWSGETASGRPACLAMFDHPSNPRHPSPWYVAVRRGIPFHYFSPALLFKETYTIPAGKALMLKYRILVRAGLTDRKAMDAEFSAFLKTK